MILWAELKSSYLKTIEYQKKLYLPTKFGGLGLINIRDFITALQVSWLKKAIDCSNDIWKIRLRVDTENFVRFDKYNNNGADPVSNIIKSTSRFVSMLTTAENNFLAVPILNNPNFGSGRNLNIKITPELMFMVCNGNLVKAANTTWSNLTDENYNFKSCVTLSNSGFTLNLDTYNRLRTTYNIAKNKFFKPGAVACDLIQYLQKFKSKGISRKLRSVLALGINPDPELSRQIATYSASIMLPVPGNIVTTNWLTAWARTMLPAEVRIFLFKLYSNRLMVNSRASHFNTNINAGCDQCVRAGTLPPPSETVTHLFWDCPTSQKLIKYTGDRILNPGKIISNELFFTGTDRNQPQNEQSKVILIFFDIVRYVIWENKWQKSKISDYLSHERILFLWGSVLRACKKLLTASNNSHLFNFHRDE
jgi:hypothetical protein